MVPGAASLALVAEPVPASTVGRCPETDLWLLPTGSGEFTRWLPSWGNLVLSARELVLPLVTASAEQDRRMGGPLPDVRLVRQTFGLLPCPDNDYNPQAIAVVLPNAGELDMSRQIAWVKNDHVRSLQPSVVALADAAGGPVGCVGIVELQRYVADVDYDASADPWDADPDDAPVLTEAESREYQYLLSGFRADIDSWGPVREAVLAFASSRVRGRILPLIGHRSPWSQDGKAVQKAMRAVDGRTRISLIADAESLDAYWQGVHVTRLHPEPRQFFTRTHARVLTLGGRADAEAVGHAGGVEVFVEDDRSAGS